VSTDAVTDGGAGDPFGIQPIEHLSGPVVLGADQGTGRHADIVEVQRVLLLGHQHNGQALRGGPGDDEDRVGLGLGEMYYDIAFVVPSELPT
jgi:hypothetical protein